MSPSSQTETGRISTTALLRGLRRFGPWLLLLTPFLVALWVASGAKMRRADFAFNNGTEVATLDPATVTGQPEGRILNAILEGLLVKHPETMEPLPGQAESWEVSEDGLTYTFHMRKDNRWSNGDKLTAEDFRYSFRRMLHPETAAQYAYLLWYVRGARNYSLWPNDCFSSTEAWIRPEQRRSNQATSDDGPAAVRAGDRVQLGWTPQLLERLPASVEGVEPSNSGPVSVGQSLATLVSGEDSVEWLSPLSGKLINVRTPSKGDLKILLDNPFGKDFYQAELELDEAGAELLNAMPAGRFWREQHLWNEVGIRVKDPLTLELELQHRTSFFLHLLSYYALFPVHRASLEGAKKQWPDRWQSEWVRPDYMVTNGPFRLKARRINDRIRLVKNRQYWDADNVAFNTIDALVITNYGTAFNVYTTGECDWLNASIPNSLVPRLRYREDFQSAPYLGSYFYRINVTKPPLDDLRVRKALALTIDRNEICKNVTKGGQKALYGLIPPGIPGYSQQAFGHEDIFEAKQLLEQAGYGPEGERFPTIEIHYNTSETHRDIAEVIADSWRRNLGIDVQFLNQEFGVYLDSQANLKYDVSRSAWIADYPDPNTFLDLFVTDGENNKTGWSHPPFDSLIAEAAAEPSESRRSHLMQQAESMLMEELPILPIYSYSSQNLVNPRLGGFYENLQDVHFPKFWFWLSDQELEAKRKSIGKQRADARGPKAGQHPTNPVWSEHDLLWRETLGKPKQPADTHQERGASPSGNTRDSDGSPKRNSGRGTQRGTTRGTQRGTQRGQGGQQQ